MNIILSFMDKIYSDTKTLSIIYIVGSILLFIFIVLLIFSLRKPDKKKEEKIIEEPNIDKEETKIEEIKKEEPKIEDIKEVEPIKDNDNNKLENILNVTEIEKNKKDEEKKIEEVKEINETKLSSEIPSIDEYVDNIVNKTYEKNEQFSSVYVSNTNTINLEKVLDKMNVDEDIKDKIVPEDEKKKEEQKDINEIVDETTIIKEVEPLKEEPIIDNKLDNLKKALEEKKNEVKLKQDDLKNKLDALKKENTESTSLEDIKNKLNINSNNQE